jgi:hypothetical protein
LVRLAAAATPVRNSVRAISERCRQDHLNLVALASGRPRELNNLGTSRNSGRRVQFGLATAPIPRLAPQPAPNDLLDQILLGKFPQHVVQRAVSLGGYLGFDPLRIYLSAVGQNDGKLRAEEWMRGITFTTVDRTAPLPPAGTAGTAAQRGLRRCRPVLSKGKQ